ncbi:hypothetical protein BpHYR1_022501 [Brachionus plicatilis]|uniref:Uncharacterized protein n=1 Tax=Brachionus plicatilis TaxID=10195 RepID=A0A3M7R427_BRAPC|nr:hypothetical protein BpHYR1_022501 [Brachionus plicatilis]
MCYLTVYKQNFNLFEIEDNLYLPSFRVEPIMGPYYISPPKYSEDTLKKALNQINEKKINIHQASVRLVSEKALALGSLKKISETVKTFSINT